MIVCQCMNITDDEINAAIEWMRASDETALITPGKIYHALGKHADCGGCMPLFLATMRSNGDLKVPEHLRHLRSSPATQTKDMPHERRHQSNRISQLRAAP